MFRMGGSPHEFQRQAVYYPVWMDQNQRIKNRFRRWFIFEIIEAQDKASKEYLGEDDYTAKQDAWIL